MHLMTVDVKAIGLKSLRHFGVAVFRKGMRISVFWYDGK